MLCAYFRDGRWHSLAGHQDQDGGLVLLERRGACPGDADGELITVTGRFPSREVLARAADWLARGWASASGDRVAARHAALAPASTPVAHDPADRALTPVQARAVVAAAVDGGKRPFCLFPNPAAHHRA